MEQEILCRRRGRPLPRGAMIRPDMDPVPNLVKYAADGAILDIILMQRRIRLFDMPSEHRTAPLL